MNYDQFQVWVDHHGAKFTGVARWLDSLATKTETLKAWFLALRDVDVEHAKIASDRMFSGEETNPRGFDLHPAAIRAIALRLSEERKAVRGPRQVEGNRTYRCQKCLDQGWVTVWSAGAMTAARRGELDDFMRDKSQARAVAVPCDCELGSRIARAQGRESLTPAMLIASMSPYCEVEQSRLLKHVENLRPVAVEWVG